MDKRIKHAFILEPSLFLEALYPLYHFLNSNAKTAVEYTLDKCSKNKEVSFQNSILFRVLTLLNP